MHSIHRTALAGLTGIAVLLAAGCSSLPSLGGILGGGDSQQQGGDVVAEVQSVDTRSRAIRIETQDGQRGDVRYDDRTRVIYRNQEYPVRALERGDIVRMRLQETQNRELYTDLIQVEQSVQERRGEVRSDRDDVQGAIERVEGTIDEIDEQGGRFTLDTSSRGEILVYLPVNPSHEDIERFRTLDEGDYVRVEGRFLEDDRFEMTAFR